MKNAGLTVGGFYAHFVSKNALLRESLEMMLRESRERLKVVEHYEGVEWVAQLARGYLSRWHRDSVEEACPLPLLSAEVQREGKEAREIYEDHLRGMVAELARKMPTGPNGLDSEERAYATLALLMGGMSLARAVQDEELSNKILRACRRLAVPEGAETSPLSLSRAGAAQTRASNGNPEAADPVARTSE